MRFVMTILATLFLVPSTMASPVDAGPSPGAFLRQRVLAAQPKRAVHKGRRHRALRKHISRARSSRGPIRDLVIAAARRHGVPVDLAVGVAFVESGFRPRWNGIAAGVMQIRPATARSVGCSGRVHDLMQAAYGINCGMKYLAMVWHHAGSRYRAAALYTQGIGAHRVSRAGAHYARMVLAAR
ncbi:MAG: transglycosylase SLT domain-containing protein [Hyphomicrobiales bacterium]|nr:transglycosylase SLT domain-containing protein [Hyphomicrobiales bacterium]MDE2113819.1 transglycosylase SLT domain-containing protein [Hyphomicrobiales bacterium]